MGDVSDNGCRRCPGETESLGSREKAAMDRLCDIPKRPRSLDVTSARFYSGWMCVKVMVRECVGVGVGALNIVSGDLIRHQHRPTMTRSSRRDRVEAHSDGGIWIER